MNFQSIFNVSTCHQWLGWDYFFVELGCNCTRSCHPVAGGRVGCGVIREPEYNWIVFVPPEPYPADPSEDYLR